MRGLVPEFELRTPKNFPEALKLLAADWRPFAGGTDLMVQYEAGALKDTRFVSLQGLKELSGIKVEKGYVELGSLTTYADIQRHPVMQREFPLLVRAASETGAIAIQNRGTLGGNIANSSPAADTPPVLLVYGATLELAKAKGERTVDYAEFHTGYKKTLLERGEIIRRVRLQRGKSRWRQYYRKVGTRNAQAISKVVFAGAGDTAGNLLNDIRIALGSVAPTVIRCYETEKLMKAGEWELARERFQDELHPIDDIRSTAQFRRQVALNLFDEFMEYLGCRIG